MAAESSQECGGERRDHGCCIAVTVTCQLAFSGGEVQTSPPFLLDCKCCVTGRLEVDSQPTVVHDKIIGTRIAVNDEGFTPH